MKHVEIAIYFACGERYNTGKQSKAGPGPTCSACNKFPSVPCAADMRNHKEDNNGNYHKKRPVTQA